MSESMSDLVRNWTGERDGNRWCRRCGAAVEDVPAERVAHLETCEGDPEKREFLIGGLPRTRPEPAPPREPWPGPTYEFFVHQLSSPEPSTDVGAYLDLFGSEGWSVVAPLVTTAIHGFPPGAVGYTYTYALVFQRPRRETFASQPEDQETDR